MIAEMLPYQVLLPVRDVVLQGVERNMEKLLFEVLDVCRKGSPVEVSRTISNEPSSMTADPW
jgi:hypothetical protein